MRKNFEVRIQGHSTIKVSKMDVEYQIGSDMVNLQNGNFTKNII